MEYTYFYKYLVGRTVLLLLLASFSYGQETGSKTFDPFDIAGIPVPPPKEKWHFISDLQSPYWKEISWSEQCPEAGYADLAKGITLKSGFPDPGRRLATAYDDLGKFCVASGISFKEGGFLLETFRDPLLQGEEFRLEIESDKGRLFAGHADGIRRGIFFMEDEMVSRKGPFLPLGIINRKPSVERRISRCFFSPIKRPGNNPGVGDELIDETDYYPEEYLNRLAHEGVNGLWLTVSSKDGDGNSVGFGDLVSTSITPNEGVNGEKRLAKLKSVVDKCLRYGIRIYIKTMEPHVRFKKDDPILKKFPDVAGSFIRDHYYLCATGEAGQMYLYEAVKKIFTAVPELGGIVNISHGELYTTCLSALPATGGGQITCPRCSKIPEWKILYHSLTAMKKGMAAAAPGAELISWLYMPQPQWQSADSENHLADWVYEIPSHTPPGVILQFNFESGVEKEVFGKKLIGGDYWISTPGPSERFVRVAKSAKEKHTRVSAKIQTGTSYEVSTVPYVPVPSLLYQKFRAMKELGVSHTMLNWIVGASPGLMNKAAGLLSGNEYKDEDAFLEHLASLYWKREDVRQVTRAWRFFSGGYGNYPLTNLFQYYGPVNDGPAWPLLLYPHDAILAPTYQLGSRNTLKPWAPSGDRVGECFTELLSLDEVTELCRRMSDEWERGLRIFDQLEANYRQDPDRLLDIGIARALGIQFRSAYNIFRFYALREEMFRTEGDKRKLMLGQLAGIIKEEIGSGRKLIALCRNDSRLGFHADAEGYKYFPEKLQWRIDQLTYTLNHDVPAVLKMIEEGKPLFPAYTGMQPPEGSAYAGRTPEGRKKEFYLLRNPADKLTIRWSAHYDADYLYLRLSDPAGEDLHRLESMVVNVESDRLFPAKDFRFSSSSIRFDKDGKYAEIKIPRQGIHRVVEKKPLRINISARINRKNYYWKENNPIAPRLMLGSDNPADLGWLVFD